MTCAAKMFTKQRGDTGGHFCFRESWLAVRVAWLLSVFLKSTAGENKNQTDMASGFGQSSHVPDVMSLCTAVPVALPPNPPTTVNGISLKVLEGKESVTVV